MDSIKKKKTPDPNAKKMFTRGKMLVKMPKTPPSPPLAPRKKMLNNLSAPKTMLHLKTPPRLGESSSVQSLTPFTPLSTLKLQTYSHI